LDNVPRSVVECKTNRYGPHFRLVSECVQKHTQFILV
jgi:hypothetical protein